jgi:hypothetical protein
MLTEPSARPGSIAPDFSNLIVVMAVISSSPQK